MITKKWTAIIFVLFVGVVGILSLREGTNNQPLSKTQTSSQVKTKSSNQHEQEAKTSSLTLPPSTDFVIVTRVIDGDTIEAADLGRIRLIGVDTPEVADPRKPVQCFGKEASQKTAEMLLGKEVRLESDPTQGNRDNYNRLLRYVFLKDGTNFNKWMVENGYAHEYTFLLPYKYQLEFKEAEKRARENNRGLWSPDACQNNQHQRANQCLIKGNISTKGEKIYHLPSGEYYDKTVIDETKGERWFCSETEAQAAGWRKSKK